MCAEIQGALICTITQIAQQVVHCVIEGKPNNTAASNVHHQLGCKRNRTKHEWWECLPAPSPVLINLWIKGNGPTNKVGCETAGNTMWCQSSRVEQEDLSGRTYPSPQSLQARPTHSSERSVQRAKSGNEFGNRSQKGRFQNLFGPGFTDFLAPGNWVRIRRNR